MVNWLVPISVLLPLLDSTGASGVSPTGVAGASPTEAAASPPPYSVSIAGLAVHICLYSQ